VTGALIELAREGLLLALALAAPMVIAALVAGAFTAIVGMITQVRDPAVGLAPRLAAVGLALVLTAPVIAQQASAFATRALTLVGRVGG